MSAISSPASSAPHDAKPLFRSEYGHFIGGEWVRGETGRLIEQINPNRPLRVAGATRSD
jgi:hypothetical protein